MQKENVMDIRCRRTICTHNKGHTCFSCCVNIDQCAYCKSFEKRQTADVDDLDFSKKMFEVAPEYSNFRHIKNVALTCNATKCVFNKDKVCMANGITVVEDNKKSCCATYLFEE